jgi:hypothetical protein
MLVVDGLRVSEQDLLQLIGTPGLPGRVFVQLEYLERAMKPPEVAVVDGALGFWGAIRDVFPRTRLDDDVVWFSMREHHSTEASARERVEPYLRG